MSKVGKKVNPKRPGAPIVSPAALSAVTSTNTEESFDSSLKTPERGQLLGIIRPIWTKVTESECRLTWLHEMVRQNLIVRDIESYAKSISECLRSEEMKYRAEEKKVLLGLMKVKLKDERKHLEMVQRVRERARQWLKRILGQSRKYYTIMKHIRIEMKGKRKEMRKKYDAKLNHLKKKKEDIEEEKMEAIPSEIKKYEKCKIFSKKSYEKMKNRK